MDFVDQKKLMTALGIHVNLQAHLSNFVGRSGRALKYWKEAGKTNPDPDNKKKLASVIVPSFDKLISTAKKAQKDLVSLMKETELGKIAKYETAKEFRTKNAKLIESSKTFDTLGMTFHTTMLAMLGSGLYIGMGDVDCQVCMNSLKYFNEYYNSFKIGLGRL